MPDSTKTIEQKFAQLVERERAKFAEYDKTIEELRGELARVREDGRAISRIEAWVDDLGLRVNALETRVATGREQREKWFELLDNAVQDMLKNRKMIRELYDMLGDKDKAGAR